MFDTMSSAAAAALAQIIPVFLVALIAERIVPPRALNAEAEAETGGYSQKLSRTMDLGIFVGRVLVDFVLAVAMIVETFTLLLAVEQHGYEGAKARFAWTVAVVLMVSVVYRWFLLSPPIRDLLLRWALAYITAVQNLTRSMASATQGLVDASEGMMRMASEVLRVFASVVGFLIEGISSLAFGALGGGIESLVRSLLSLRGRTAKPRRSRKRPDHEKRNGKAEGP